MLNTKLDPLKDGISSVQLIDKMGDEIRIVNAARVSMNKESGWDISAPRIQFKLKDTDKSLIKYLYTNNHWTPFAHVQVSFRVKAPIFVARQLVKHQVGLVWNEVSRRYVSDNLEFYIPESLRLKPEGNIKQGSSEETTTDFTDYINDIVKATTTVYNHMLNNGVAPEEARMILPINLYTEWIWTGSLYAFLRIIDLRCDPHSQSQTRQYGEAFKSCLKDTFPYLFEILDEIKGEF